MKKMIIITILMFLFFNTLMFSGEKINGNAGYRLVKHFMQEYYQAYNESAQDASSIDLMDKYWASEFLAYQYLPLPECLVMDLPTWKNMMVYVHLNVKETLKVEEMAIDIETMSVVSRLSITFNYRWNGELALKVDAVAYYNLKLDEKRQLKQTALKLYFSDPLAVMQLSGPPPTI